MLLASLGGEILLANQAMADLVGWENAAKGIGLSIFDFIDTPHHDVVAVRLFDPAVEGRRGSYVSRMERPDGVVRHVRYSAGPVTDRTGEPVAVLCVGKDITDGLANERELLYYSIALEAVGEAVVAFDRNFVVTHWNPAATDMFGYSRPEAIGQKIVDMIPIDVDDPEATLSEIGTTMRSGEVWNEHVPLIRRDGSSFPAYVSDSPILDGDGEFFAGIGVVIDMSAQVDAEKQAHWRAQSLSVVVAFAEEALTFYEVDWVITRASHVGAMVTQSATTLVLLFDDDDQLIVRSVAHDGVGSGVSGLVLGADIVDLDEEMSALARQALRLDASVDDDDDDDGPSEATGLNRAVAVPIRVRDDPRGLVMTIDYDERRPHDDVVDLLRSVASITAATISAVEQRTEIAQQALLDPTTGLANRVLFNDRLAQSLRRLGDNGTFVLVALCDIDAFESVNRELGETVGDQLLELLGTRLSGVLDRRDTLARVGSDQFAVLHEVDSGLPTAIQLGDQLSDAVSSKPFDLGDESRHVTVGIGVTVAEGDDSSVSILAEAADALQRAKHRGRDHIEVYDDDLRARAAEQSAVARELRGAVGRGELRLHFQPEVPARGDDVWVEALVRWQRSDGRLSKPDEFLELGHEIGLSEEIDDWVLHTAIEQMASWNASDSPTPSTVSINLSATQLSDVNRTVSVIEELLDQHGVDATSVWFEVTETQVLADLDAAVEVLQGLAELGCSIALDDFGTGFSSLTFVRELPTNALKIDRSFVSGLGENLKDETIVKTVIDLAHSLDLVCIAEGVETVAQQATLTALGCDYLQGYLFSPALPADELADWLAAYQADTLRPGDGKK